MNIRIRLLGALAATLVALPGFAQDSARTQVIDPIDSFVVEAGPRLNTELMLPAIDKTLTERPRLVRNKTLPDFLKTQVAPNSLPVGGATNDIRSPDVRQKWPAITFTGWTPPDPTLAVGKEHVVVTVNSAIAFYTKTGTQQFQQNFSTFFAGLWESSFLFDPKVYYDKIADRFFVICIEQRDSPQVSQMLIAVSDDGDPNGTWYRYRVNTRIVHDSKEYWFDYPGFGYNNSAITFAGNMFTFGTFDYGGVLYNVLPKAPMLTGASVTNTQILDTNAYTVQVAEISDPTVTSLHAINVQNTGWAKWSSITNPSTSPQLVSGFIAIPSFNYPSHWAQSISRSLDPSDGRLLNAVWRDGRLLAAHTIRTSTNSTNIVRWYEFNYTNAPATAPTLVQSGNVAGASGTHFFMPAINKNAAGDVSVIFSRSSSSIVADIMYAGRYASDADGTMGAPVLLQSSAGSLYNSNLGNRWGDYFQVDIDPLDENRFWGVSQTVRLDGNWETQVLDWTMSPTLNGISVPNQFAAGSTLLGSVTLTKNAPSGGTVVSLSSSDARLTVPTTVTVPAGASTANFSATASSGVGGTVSVTVTATLHGVQKSATTSIVGSESLKDLTLSRSVMIGGSTQLVWIRPELKDPAPAGGATVTITSSHPGVIANTSVFIKEGATRGSIGVPSNSVKPDTLVTLTGSYDGGSKSASLTVQQPRPSSLNVSPSTFTGGSDRVVTGTVNVNAPAPAGGLDVAIASGSTAISFPPTVTVPVGQTQATFDITHRVVAVQRTPAITASAGGKTVSRQVTINPPGVHKLSLSQYTVVGGVGTIVTGTVELNAPAAANNTVVSISGSPSILTMPSTVTFKKDEQILTFTILAPAVADDTEVNLQADLNGTRFAKLMVRAPLLSQTYLSTNPVTGGSSTVVTFMVELSSPAPVGGITVALSSSHPTVASMPASVTVLAGQTTATVTVTHSVVTTTTDVTLTATLKDRVRSRILRVRP
jgi:hypothetical protein